jgi:hypothetical protein
MALNIWNSNGVAERLKQVALKEEFRHFQA